MRPTRLWLAGESGRIPDLVRIMYGKADAADKVTAFTGEAQEMREAAVRFLLE